MILNDFLPEKQENQNLDTKLQAATVDCGESTAQENT